MTTEILTEPVLQNKNVESAPVLCVDPITQASRSDELLIKLKTAAVLATILFIDGNLC